MDLLEGITEEAWCYCAYILMDTMQEGERWEWERRRNGQGGNKHKHHLWEKTGKNKHIYFIHLQQCKWVCLIYQCSVDLVFFFALNLLCLCLHIHLSNLQCTCLSLLSYCSCKVKMPGSPWLKPRDSSHLWAAFVTTLHRSSESWPVIEYLNARDCSFQIISLCLTQLNGTNTLCRQAWALLIFLWESGPVTRAHKRVHAFPEAAKTSHSD